MNLHRPTSMQAIAARIAIAVVLTGPALLANDYYVDGRTGTDSPAAGSQANPWKTVPFALAQIVSPVRNTHTLFVAGHWTYTITAPITLRDRIDLVGTGASRPLFILPNSTLRGLQSDPAAMSFTGTIRSIDFVGGSTAIEVRAPTGANHFLTIEDCRFTKQATRAIDMGGSFHMLTAVRCSFADQTNAIRVQSMQTAAQCNVHHCDFERVAATAIELTAGGSASIASAIDNSRFDTCASAIVSSVNSTNRSLLAIGPCAFRHISGTAIAALVAGTVVTQKHEIRVTSSTFMGLPTAIALDCTRASGIVTALISGNVIVGASKVGIDLQLGGQPSVTPSWSVSTDGNTLENCTEGLVVRIGQTTSGRFTSSGDTVRRSTMDAMRFESSAAAFTTNLHNAMLTGNRGRALTVRSASPFFGRFLTIADNEGTALDVGSSPVTLDHVLLDNARSPEIVGGSSLSVTYSCSRITRIEGPGNFVADPKLSRPSYKLTSTSPCIDAGDPAANPNAPPYYDFEGKNRMLATTSAVVDIGADEFRARGSFGNFGADAFGVVSATRPVFVQRLGDPVIGSTFQIGAVCARGAHGQDMIGAIILFGDADGAFVADLDPLGFAGSMLYFVPRAVSPYASCSQGVAWVSVPVPNQQQLVDTVVAFQALLAVPGANAFGLVPSGGMRVQIGK
ncbi:MAG: hypothetical protein KDC95_06105 [Planctomycetes bacterium]|nr:hypothetical protein [Planctomycetota bacterium]